MSQLKESNIKMLNEFETHLKSHLIWMTKDNLDREASLVFNERHLKQFIIGLSIAILGIVFPTIIGTNAFTITIQSLFLISFILFCVVSIWGLFDLIVTTLTELTDIPKVHRHHQTQMELMIKKVQEIQEMTDNVLAGKEFKGLPQQYKHLDLGRPSLIRRLFYRYGDTILYAGFLVAFFLLLAGVFGILIPINL